jgi:FkbM family methyltransferase
VPALRNEIEDARRLLVAAEKRLRETILKLPDSPQRGRLIQQHWTVSRMLGRYQQFFSQAGQDEVLDRVVFRGRRGGVFVEIGAFDGIIGSNTLFFEIFRGWSGLLIEASPRLHARAQRLRNTPCLQVAVAPESGYAEFLDVQRGYQQMGGLVTSLGENAKKMIEADSRTESEVIRVPTRPLADILADQGLFRIDYVSIDIEGGELAVLSTFPFDRFEIGAWSVEVAEASPQIARLMSDAGFRLLAHVGVDELYVHRRLEGAESQFDEGLSNRGAGQQRHRPASKLTEAEPAAQLQRGHNLAAYQLPETSGCSHSIAQAMQRLDVLTLSLT